VLILRFNPLPKPTMINHPRSEARLYRLETLPELYHDFRPMVSAIIPARNEEAAIVRAVESVAAQAEVDEVIVVNDQSTDGTAAILAELAQKIPKLKIMNVQTLPLGWVGKNYAVSLGAAVAQGEWLLFTDADTYHMLGSTRRALADAVDHNAVLVSYSPEQELGSFWERALIPFIYARLAVHFPFSRVNNPEFPDAAANGQFLMILRDAYEKVGGHRAIADQVLEDVALARRVKGAGFSIYFTAPMGTVQTRMYRSFPAMWEGWTKNLYPLIGGSTGKAISELLEVIPCAEILGLALFWWLLVRSNRAPLWALLAFAFLVPLFRGVKANFSLYRNPNPFANIQLLIPGACLYSAVLVSSWWKNTRGAVLWKGRTYPSRL
jgi:glycosyltransferase involved in cell wall biosynthesis